MTDGELRGKLLKRFYDVRHNGGPVQLSAVSSWVFDEPVDRVANICEQLAELQLLNWQKADNLAQRNGLGRISAHGVDVIEGRASAPKGVTVNDHSVHIHGSSNVQVGSGNTLHANTTIGKLISAVDHSQASDSEKAEAKSLLQRMSENRLVTTVLATFLSSGAQ
jgi:hypothetical protein